VTPTEDTRQASRRRIQFGPSEVGAGWSPEISSSTPEEEDMYTEREVDLIVNALRDAGEMRRKDLGERIGCKYWGPGRFRRALRLAADRGQIRRVGFGRYAAS
jgi:hypothetical protein